MDDQNQDQEIKYIIEMYKQKVTHKRELPFLPAPDPYGSTTFVEVPEKVYGLLRVGDTYDKDQFYLAGRRVADNIAMIRSVRNDRINAVEWAIQRHAQEQYLGSRTTLREKDYRALLVYIQQLRDVTDTFDLTAPFTSINDLPWPELGLSIRVRLTTNFYESPNNENIILLTP